ncbi:hypothetical protein CHLNCDRAFT_136597 [Chlorella variabilis]|uniref:Tyrosine-protein kinase ephrin type A/B receptor-like domain-containing protein n=1 Tax=Chlorella variabilis TaxID=554065 RepID=E1ZKN1_CHLVA|nr:hypothetical protein CHLNCDRAFT_136597 [Chlorella variabilis]EFN53518.1 hypothetical protein CHLNCDRAFT_136597 [Chlorella variabilis]|eukprot:XP_005845620.1 hypothetical protein CHLNCDRAFT_136597 [Chlorella variabilis]
MTPNHHVQVGVAAGAPQVQMAQPTLVLPPLSNGSEAYGGGVVVSVRLSAAAVKPVTASLRLLLPSNVSSSDASGNNSSSGAWVPVDPDELWLEPAQLSWRAGEAGDAKRVRLRSAAELPLSVVLEDALYASGGTGSGDEFGAGNGVGAAPASGQPLLRVELAAASGAAIDEQRSSTTLVLEVAGEVEGDEAGASEAAAADLGLPLFGFVANQAAYPPANSSSGSDASSSGMAAIPVRLLAGRLREMATLKFSLELLSGSPAAGSGHTRQQLLPAKTMSGFLYFRPPPSAAAAGKSAGSEGQQQTAEAEQEEQLIELPLAWARIPPEAEYRLGLELEAIYHARVQPQPDAVALHIFGSPLGTCPPGFALKQPGAGSGGANGAARGSASPVSSSDGSFSEEADFGLFLNGTVIDLSSSLIDAGVREYAAMVESDVPTVTLCLLDSSQGPGSVQTVPAAGSNKAVAALRPAPTAVAESACGCEGGGSQESASSVQGSSSVTSIRSEDSSRALDGVSTKDAATSISTKGSSSVGAEDACEYTAWVLPLQAGQNEFTVTLPGEAQEGLAPAPPPAVELVRSMSGPADGGGSGGQEQYSLAVVRLADPEHAELESITGKQGPVRSSDDTAVLLCGPSSSSGSRKLPSRAALDTGSDSLVVPLAAEPCVPGQLLSLNVSERSRLVSLTPALKRPNVAGVRVEVNGQVLSRGGDVAADQLEDTTAAQQQRSNASFLPSAFIMGLLPGSRLEAEVVVVAEDGVTTRRYPLEFVVVAGRDAQKQQLAVAEAAATGGNATSAAAAGPSTRQRVNSSACHMCPPGTFARSEQSPACLACGPGTFAYSWGSAYCKNCIEGTHAPTANASLCLPCPANTTTRDDGSRSCDVPLRPGTYQAPRYAVVVSFWVTLTGVDPEDVVVRAGVNAAPEAIVTSLIRADTAHQFNISLDDVEVVSVRQVARRTLSANVTATLGVDVPAGATDEDIAAAMEVERLSADDPIGMLSSDPDRFFGRTAKTLEVQVESAVQATTESRPGGTPAGL